MPEQVKNEYNIPVYVNAWLAEIGVNTGYPRGGPIARMMPVWRAAAPNIDLYAPDIYVENFKEVCDEYAQAGNPLFIPEIKNTSIVGAKLFYPVGEHGALGISPFGIDQLPDDHPMALSYKILNNLNPLLIQFNGSGKTKGFYLYDKTTDTLNFEKVKIQVQKYSEYPGDNSAVASGGIIIQVSETEYFIAGMNFNVQFIQYEKTENIEFIYIEEGEFNENTWEKGRRIKTGR
ncbi:MAG: DUF5597 domain-containing protein [Bacteroidales bacterium]|nr:DUF5597 domain-containing protein [Bacteroidales bacterium]